jgi:hypothetical protein
VNRDAGFIRLIVWFAGEDQGLGERVNRDASGDDLDGRLVLPLFLSSSLFYFRSSATNQKLLPRQARQRTGTG